jgi:hypothetical protein
MTEEWKVLTDEQKQPYILLSEREKQRYEEQKRVYNANKANEKAAEGEKLAGKKRPAAAPAPKEVKKAIKKKAAEPAPQAAPAAPV